jgi:gliding motility-associated-like protein
MKLIFSHKTITMMKHIMLLSVCLLILITPAKSQSCENINFEMGDFTNWVGKTGTCCPINLSTTGIENGRHTIMTNTSGTDYHTGNQLRLIPTGYKYSARLGNDNTGAQAEGLSYTLTVDANNSLFIYKFAVVLEDPNHSEPEQPRFQIRVKDQLDHVIHSCTEYTVIAAASIPNFQSNGYVRWRDWTTVGLDLSPYTGQTVTIELMTGDCSQGGHYGYAYFVAQCAPMKLVASYCPGSDTAIIIAPEGFESYLWSSGATARTDTVISPMEDAVFSCELTSVTGCKANLSAVMKIAILTADFENDSCSNTVTFNNLSTVNVGDINCLWNFGDGTSSTEVNPVHVFPSAGEYDVRLIATSDLVGCKDTITKKVHVILDLTVRDTSICAESTALFVASSTAADVMFSWYANPGYSNLIIQNDSLQTTELTADTDFYIEVSGAGCILRDTVHATVLPLPYLTVEDTAVCYGKTATPKAYSFDAVSLKWYRNPDYSGIIAQAASFTTAALTADTVFYVEALSANDCISRDSVKVTVYPLPALNVEDTAVCFGNTAIATASTDNATLTWYSDPAYSDLIIQAASFVTAALRNDTVFFIKAQSLYGCISTGSEQVAMYPLPNLTTNNIVVCFDSTAVVTASSADAVALRWFKDANYTDTIIKSAIFETTKLKADTVFYIEAISVNGCISRDTAHVTVLPLPDLNVGDTAVCYGETATPNAASSDAVALKWYSDPDYSVLITDAASFTTAALLSDTVFYAEAVSAEGCISRDTLRITVYPLPELIVRDTTICAETMTVFTAESSDAASITWYGDDVYSDTIIQSASYETMLTADAVFYIEALSDKGCSTRGSIDIQVIKRPAVTAMEDAYLCYGQEITLFIVDSDGAVNWDVEPLTVKPQTSQQYIVTASREPCPDVYDTVNVTVGDSLYIYPAELPPYKAHSDYSQQINSNAQSPTYTIVDGNLPFGLNLYRYGDLSGTPYSADLVSVFTVQVEDDNRCTVTREYALEKEFFVPTAFTPNGDGINDFFMKGYKVVIFDRLGIEIFRGDDGWDGTYKNKTAPPDIYFYLITKSENGKNKAYTGYIGVR